MTETPDHETVGAIAGLMRLLSDPTRLRVLRLLLPGEQNVSALCDRLGLAQPTVSHHLGLLRTARLVVTRRNGKQVYYALNPDHFQPCGPGLKLDHSEVRLWLWPEQMGAALPDGVARV